MHRRDGSLRQETPLDAAIVHLRHVQSAVIVAIAALRRQNVELDEDIARLLQRCVCDRIDEQLEKLEAARGGALPRVTGSRPKERRASGRPWRRGRRPGPRGRALAS